METSLKEHNHTVGIIEGAYHEAALRLGLSDSELNILYTLNEHPQGCNQSVLYKETGMTKSTVNSAIRKMENEQILYLTPGAGRNTCVCLTDNGRKLVVNTVHRLIRLENEIFAEWSEMEQADFIRLNREFAEKLGRKVREL